MNNSFLFNCFVFLAAACVVVPVASRFRLGSVLGYLLAGVIVGPFGLGLIHNPQQIMSFAEFGVVMMLFLIGLELQPAMLWKMRNSIIGLGGLQVLVTSLAFMGIGMAFGFGWQMSLAVGMALALSSTALVLQMLEERNLMQTSVGETAFAVLLFQDIAVIPILVLMPLLAVHSGDAVSLHAAKGWVGELPGWQHAILVAAVIAAVIAIGRHASYYIFSFIAKINLREVFTATSLMLVVGITLLMQLVGVSPALGAFVAGVTLANSEYKRTLETDIEPFKGLLLGLFFISVGMGMDFSLLKDQPLNLLGIVLILMSVKAVILWVLGHMCKQDPLYNIGLALGLCQGGEFAFVLFQFAGGLQIIAPHQVALLTLAVAISIALTPLLILLYERKVVPKFMSMLPERDYDAIEESHNVIIAGYGRFGQIIGRFLVAQGITVTILEKDPNQIELLRKFGVKGYFGDASRLDLLKSAQADKAELLVIAVDDADVGLEIARLAKESFPGLKIFARARNRRHAYELHKIGVDYFKRETFDSSLTMAREVMVALGRNPEDMARKAQAFQQHDEASLVKSFAFFESEPELVNFARLSREELENILKADIVDEK